MQNETGKDEIEYFGMIHNLGELRPHVLEKIKDFLEDMSEVKQLQYKSLYLYVLYI